VSAVDLTGQVFSRLTVVSRAENISDGRVRWVCRCSCGAETTVRGGDLIRGATRSCGCRRREVGAANGRSSRHDTVGYAAAHFRVSAVRGSASDHACADGCGRQAADWAFVATGCTHQSWHTDHRGATLAFCQVGDPACYVPKCRRCHRRESRINELRVCDWCCAGYIAIQVNAKFCGPECRRAANNAARRRARGSAERQAAAGSAA
jgi:hypothetical protein